jgi:short-chain 2-methylacyl-CoA dehydrogenase
VRHGPRLPPTLRRRPCGADLAAPTDDSGRTIAGVHVEFTDEQDALRKLVRDFAEGEIAPHAERWDAEHTFPTDTVRQMGDLGLFGIPFPEEYGGGGSDLTSLCIAIEELGRVDQSLAITLEAGVGLGANPIFRFGSEAQRQKWLPDLCAGRALGGFGLTEPDAGSDAGGTRTRAHLDGDLDGGEWVIDGEKAFITNSGTDMTSLVTVTARTGGAGAGAASEISAIIVPAGTPGFTVQPPYRKMGWHASDTHALSFSDCRVPAANLLGERGRGFAQFLEILDEGRIAIAALAVGVIRCCLEQSVAYAGDRLAFGRPIGANQAVAFACSDMAVMAETASLLTYQAAWRRDTGRPYKREAAMAKLYATEAAVSATRMATQVFGGYGFMDETLVARQYRDAKILEIGEGTSEIQRLVIARDLGLPVT